MDKVVLDAFAILALLGKEKGHEKVKECLESSGRGEIKTYMSLLNWGGIYYTLKKKGKSVDSDEFWEARRDYPIVFVGPTIKRIKDASDIKGAYPVSYMDAFCIALAMELKAKILTGDPEFKAVDELGLVWIG